MSDLSGFSLWDLFRGEVETQSQALTSALLVLGEHPDLDDVAFRPRHRDERRVDRQERRRQLDDDEDLRRIARAVVRRHELVRHRPAPLHRVTDEEPTSVVRRRQGQAVLGRDVR